MRPRNAVFVIPLLALLSYPVHANGNLNFTKFSGLDITDRGSARAVATADGRGLHVTGIGDTQTDGFDVVLSNFTGHAIHSSSAWTRPPVAPADRSVGPTMTYSWTVARAGGSSGVPLSSGGLELKRGYDYYQAKSDLSALSLTPTMTCLGYLRGVLVASVSCPSSSAAGPQVTISLGSSDQVPDVTLDIDNRSHRALMSVQCSSHHVFVFGGASHDCDQVVFVAEVDGDAKLDVCSVRCAFPPSWSLSTLDFDNESFVFSGQQLTSTGGECSATSDQRLSVRSITAYENNTLEGRMSLHERVFGPGGGGAGGCGGGACDALSSLYEGSPPISLLFSPSDALVFAETDKDCGLRSRLLGTGTCSPDGVAAELSLSFTFQKVDMGTRFSNMCADHQFATVFSRGQPVGELAMSVDGGVSISSPPGGPPLTPVCAAQTAQKSRSNIQNNLVMPEDGTQRIPETTPDAGIPMVGSLVGPNGLELGFTFLTPRTFCVGTSCLTGDEIRVTGQCTSGVCSPITITGSEFSLHRTSTGGGPSTLDILDIPSSPGDRIAAVIPTTVALTSRSPVVKVPVVIVRDNLSAARGASVTLSFSPNVVLASPIEERAYFSPFGPTQLFDVDHGGGSHTVDLALLGPSCGPTTSGTLFWIPISRAPGAPDGLGFVSIDAVEVADCAGGPIPSSPGGRAYIVLDSTSPSAATTSAAQVTSGNDADGTIKLAHSWTVSDPLASVELYCAGYGGYPEFKDAGGSPPPAPIYPPSGRWKHVVLKCGSSVAGTSVCTDETSTRDAYEFVVYAVDSYGNVSPPSNITPLLVNYIAGDVAGGGAPCAGNNEVRTDDISALGAHYGARLPIGSPFECLDVGPTADGTVSGLPLTDHLLSFKDLLIYAIDYLSGPTPETGPRPTAAATNALRLRLPAIPGVGQTFDATLEMSGAGDAQGLSVQLTFDPAVVEAVSVSQGELLGRQGRQGVVLSAQPGNVDAVLLGVGSGIAGEGDLARVTFRMKAQGDPALGIAGAEARDSQNRTLALNGVGTPGATPGRTALRMAFPNPFDRSTTVVLSLHEIGPASVRVFDVAGRTVRTLLAGVQPAGERMLAWDGRDDAGVRLGAGVYMLRLDAGGHSETRSIRLIK